jgi:hypothetical protein
MQHSCASVSSIALLIHRIFVWSQERLKAACAARKKELDQKKQLDKSRDQTPWDRQRLVSSDHWHSVNSCTVILFDAIVGGGEGWKAWKLCYVEHPSEAQVENNQSPISLFTRFWKLVTYKHSYLLCLCLTRITTIGILPSFDYCKGESKLGKSTSALMGTMPVIQLANGHFKVVVWNSHTYWNGIDTRAFLLPFSWSTPVYMYSSGRRYVSTPVYMYSSGRRYVSTHVDRTF